MKSSSMLLFWLVLSILLQLNISGCGTDDDCSDLQFPPDNDDRVTIEQGIYGNVWLWEGDFMPLCPDGTITAVERDIFIHELTSAFEDVIPPRGTFYSSINTDLIAEVSSDESGFYQVELPQGTYSIVIHYVQNDTLYYANWFDGHGNISPIEVKEGNISKFNIDIFMGTI